MIHVTESFLNLHELRPGRRMDLSESRFNQARYHAGSGLVEIYSPHLLIVIHIISIDIQVRACFCSVSDKILTLLVRVRLPHPNHHSAWLSTTEAASPLLPTSIILYINLSCWLHGYQILFTSSPKRSPSWSYLYCWHNTSFIS